MEICVCCVQPGTASQRQGRAARHGVFKSRCAWNSLDGDEDGSTELPCLCGICEECLGIAFDGLVQLWRTGWGIVDMNPRVAAACWHQVKGCGCG